MWFLSWLETESLAVVPDFAQSSRHGVLYSFTGGSPGPGVGPWDVDVDGVAVLALSLTGGEHSQPGQGGLLICRGDGLTVGPKGLQLEGYLWP